MRVPWIVEAFEADGDALVCGIVLPDTVTVERVRDVFSLAADDPAYDIFRLTEVSAKALGVELPARPEGKEVDWFLGYVQ